MRRRRSRLAALAIIFSALGAAPAVAPLGSCAVAQSGSAGEGALDLLIPTGASVLGMGQAAVAGASPLAGLWWNPAIIAGATKREIGYHFAQSLFAANDNTLTALVPIRRVGAVSLSGRYIDYGEQEATDVIGPTGLLATRSFITLGTFGAPIGPAELGLSLKYFRQLYDCTGECPNAPSGAASTSAIDVGIRYHGKVRGYELDAGASLVNLGRALQVKDAPQADPLPTRLLVGVGVVPDLSAIAPEATSRFGLDFVTRLNGIGSPGIRAGAELGWQGKYQVRGGYSLYSPTGSGFSVGIGLSAERLQVDVAQFLSDIGSKLGQRPTYFSLRYELR